MPTKLDHHLHLSKSETDFFCFIGKMAESDQCQGMNAVAMEMWKMSLKRAATLRKREVRFVKFNL